MASYFPPADEDEKIQALRAEIIGRRQPIPVIARVNDESERAVYQNIDRYDVSFIKVGAFRYIDPVEYAEKRAKEPLNKSVSTRLRDDL